MKFSQIKILTKGILNGNIGKTFLFFIFGLLLIIVFTAVPVIADQLIHNNIVSIVVTALSMLIFSFVSCALRTGCNAWFHFYKRKKRLGRAMFWLAPKNSLKAFGLYVALFLVKTFWTILLLLPGVAIMFSFSYLAYDAGIEFNLFLCGVVGGGILFVMGLVFRFFIVQKYFLAKTILVENPGASVLSAIRQSREIMDGNLKKTAFFKLSFAPWFLICVGVFPILYVWPYYRQSCTVFASEIRKVD